MKKLMFAVLILIMAVKLSAQDISYSQNGNHRINRFYVDVLSKAANMNGNWAVFGGFRAGYNINADFSLGAVAYGLVPNRIDNSYINQKGRNELHLGFLGAEGTYKYNLSERFYLNGMMMMGSGRANCPELDGNDYFFIMQPGVSVNYRVSDWFGIGYSLNYRLASGVKYSDYTDATFSGWSMDIGFKFGF